MDFAAWSLSTATAAMTFQASKPSSKSGSAIVREGICSCSLRPTGRSGQSLISPSKLFASNRWDMPASGKRRCSCASPRIWSATSKRPGMGRIGPERASVNPRPSSWKWWVCGLLLFASMINYMDRQTLANVAVRITNEFKLNQEQYGNLELVFGWAFAIGSLLFGIIADAVSVRWLYPAVLLFWSATGFATAFVHTYAGLLVCRTMLDLFEAGHWPCGLKTTQRLLNPEYRTMGNSVLQSGTSIGAVLPPLIITTMLTNQ